MKLEITITNGFLEYLKDFETADSAYLAAQNALFDSLDAGDDQWDALKSVRDSAYSNRDNCAVVLARFLVTVVSSLADAPEDSPVDAPVKCLRCRYFGDPDPFDPEHRQPLQCCFAPDDDYDDMPCADTPADDNSRSPAP